MERFEHHSQTSYHQDCTAKANASLDIACGNVANVLDEIDSQGTLQKKENKTALIRIIETVMLCGEQELPLRGDDDSDGPLTLDKPEVKDGKFRALLRYRAKGGDEKLKSHIINSPKNATSVSPKIQNEIIEICGLILEREVVSKINSPVYFTILADKTMDVYSIE